MTATGPAVLPVDPQAARDAIERDLELYAAEWRRVQLVEVEAPYGPLHPDEAEKQELRRSGTCLLDVTFCHGEDCIEASFDGGCGEMWAKDALVVISRRHPSIDQQKVLQIKSRRAGRMILYPGIPELEVQNVTWRLDLQAHYVPYYRVCGAIGHFTTLPPSSPLPAFPVLIGSQFGNSQQRRAINETVTPRTPVDEAALGHLNPSQRHAVKRSLAQRVLLIQGPPGTGKTQVADAIFRVWRSTGAPGPAVGAAPSNVAADNLASRLLRRTRLAVRRYGDTDKIKDPDVREISSQAMALKADWAPLSNMYGGYGD